LGAIPDTSWNAKAFAGVAGEPHGSVFSWADIVFSGATIVVSGASIVFSGAGSVFSCGNELWKFGCPEWLGEDDGDSPMDDEQGVFFVDCIRSISFVGGLV
jgi:hypothetical protein